LSEDFGSKFKNTLPIYEVGLHVMRHQMLKKWRFPSSSQGSIGEA
jgi:hypothetical protein